MSGARIIQSLIYVLKENTAKYGMASICNGGGLLIFFFNLFFSNLI